MSTAVITNVPKNHLQWRDHRKVYFRRLGNEAEQIATLERQKDDGIPSEFEWFNCTLVR